MPSGGLGGRGAAGAAGEACPAAAAPSASIKKPIKVALFIRIPSVLFLTGPPEFDIPQIGAHPQRRAAAIETAFGIGVARPPLAALGSDLQLREIGDDLVAIGHLDG